MLKVWLPLDGDLRNLGCSDIEITNNGATINNAGKIGKCYSFDGTNDYIVGTYQATTNISFCCWVNFPTVPAGRHLFDARTRSGVGYQPMYINTSFIQIGGSGSSFPSISYSWIANTWYHICVTHDQNNGKLYINGELIATTAAKGFEGGVCNFTLGSRCNQSNYCSAKINDVRIYDHCLSAAEVKEIAQGLVVHYKLDQPVGLTEAILNQDTYIVYNNFASSGTTGTLTNLSEYFNGHIVRREVMTPNDSSVNNFRFFLGAHGVYGHRQTFLANTKYVFWIYYRPISHTDIRAGGTASNIGGWTEIPPIAVGGGWYRVGQYRDGTVTTDKTDNIFTSFYTPTAESGVAITIDWAAPHLLVGTTEIPDDDSFMGNDYIEDSSGYGHNGTITGTIIAQSESPRYNFSVYLNGSSYISTAAGTMSWYQMDYGTLACWMKPTDSMIGWRGSWGICQDAAYGQKGWAITDYGNTFRITYTNGSTYKTETSGKTLPQNEWHHCAATLDGTTVKMYFDGELVETVTIDWGTATMPTATRMELGVDFPGSHEMFTGNYSDARFYVTPLSDDDIKSLYNTSMKIDNLQNIHTFELVENQDKISITKTGQLTCDELNEDTAAKLYKSGIIETAELIER